MFESDIFDSLWKYSKKFHKLFAVILIPDITPQTSNVADGCHIIGQYEEFVCELASV